MQILWEVMGFIMLVKVAHFICYPVADFFESLAYERRFKKIMREHDAFMNTGARWWKQQQKINQAQRIAEAKAAAKAEAHVTAVRANLKTLNLRTVPNTKAQLQEARRRVMFQVHYDKTGNAHVTYEVNRAYDELMRQLGLVGADYNSEATR